MRSTVSLTALLAGRPRLLRGMSTEAIAQRLGCPGGTVLSRLSRARSRLKERLESRRRSVRIDFPLAKRSADSFRSALAPLLVQNTICAAGSLALAGASIEITVPATVATLSRGVIRTLAFANARPAAIFMVMAVACVSMGLAATSAPAQWPNKRCRGRACRAISVAVSRRPNTGKEGGRNVQYAGLLLDPDGKPVAGAKLHLAYWRMRAPLAPRSRGRQTPRAGSVSP